MTWCCTTSSVWCMCYLVFNYVTWILMYVLFGTCSWCVIMLIEFWCYVEFAIVNAYVVIWTYVANLMHDICWKSIHAHMSDIKCQVYVHIFLME